MQRRGKVLAVFPDDFNETVELLAGYPFHLAVNEIMEMDARELAWWAERAGRRLERENKGLKNHG